VETGGGTGNPSDGDTGGSPPEAGPGAIDSGPCAPGLTLCGTACVQTRSDPNHCGACNAACTATPPSSAECVIGECVVTLATATPSAATDLAVDATHVYWTDQVDNTIQRIPLGGGPVESLVTDQMQAHHIALDATSIYWLSNGVNGGVWKSGRDGSGPTRIVPLNNITDLAVTAAGVYFLGGPGAVSVLPTGADASVAVATGGDFPSRLAVDDHNVYYTEYGTTVYRAPLDGGVTVPLTTSQGIPQSGLALTATDVYWGTGSLTMSAPLAGGAAQTRASTALFGVAVHGEFLYGFTPTGSIVKIPLAGGRAETLVFRNTSSAYTILDIAVDDTSVYWTETANGVGSVLKVTPR
jgi:hypothetical protein